MNNPTEPDIWTACGLTREQLAGFGVDPKHLDEAFSDGYLDTRNFVYRMMPWVVGKTDANSLIKIQEGMALAREFRVASTAAVLMGYKAARDDMRATGAKLNNCVKKNNELVEAALAKGRENEKLIELLKTAKAEILQISERNGIFATQDKHDLATAQAHIKELKGQLDGIRLTMEGQMALIRKQDEDMAFAKLQVQEAEGHGKSALERLLDRFPNPDKTPFFGPIIDELKLLLGGLPQ